MTAPILLPSPDKTLHLSELLRADPTKPGALEERFQVELARVIENMADPNTDPEQPRRITITMIFKPDKERRKCGIALDVVSKLVGPDGLFTEAYIGRDQGRPAIVEGPTQTSIFDKPEMARPTVLEGGKA